MELGLKGDKKSVFQEKSSFPVLPLKGLEFKLFRKLNFKCLSFD